MDKVSATVSSMPWLEPFFMEVSAMSARNYFKFYPSDWLESDSIFMMTLEQDGAYIRLLAAMWKNGAVINDDPKLICNILRCSPAKWRKLRAALVEDLGVIEEKNGKLFNRTVFYRYRG